MLARHELNASDKVNHFALYSKVIEKYLPRFRMFSKIATVNVSQLLTVKWNDALAIFFM